MHLTHFWVIQEEKNAEQFSVNMKNTEYLQYSIIKNKLNVFPFHFGEICISEGINVRILAYIVTFWKN